MSSNYNAYCALIHIKKKEKKPSHFIPNEYEMRYKDGDVPAITSLESVNSRVRFNFSARAIKVNQGRWTNP